MESCLLSRSTLSSLVKLLPIAEYDLWVREMTVDGLDFRNPVGPDTFACFKRVCVFKRNTNENFGENTISKDNQSFSSKKTVKSNYQAQIQDKEIPDLEQCVLMVGNANPTSWNPSLELKFPCLLINHEHEVRKCNKLFFK